MTGLDFAEETWAGIAAFYSIIHIAPALMSQTLQQLWRVLRPDGLLLLSFHIGSETIHLDEWWGRPVSVDSFFLDPQAIASHLHDAGFEVEEIIGRAPYPEVEHQSRRAYIFARKLNQRSNSGFEATDAGQKKSIGGLPSPLTWGNSGRLIRVFFAHELRSPHPLEVAVARRLTVTKWSSRIRADEQGVDSRHDFR